MANRYLRDLLYFDFDKAASLWSQLAEGLREKVSLTAETQGDKKGSFTLGFPKVVEASIGGTTAEKRSALESKTLHHDLLNLLESGLTQLGLVTDLNQSLSTAEASAEAIRSTLGVKPYVIAHGRSVIEDCKRINTITSQLLPIVEFISTCAAQAKPEIQQLLAERENRRHAIGESNDKHKKQRLEHEANLLTEKIQTAIRQIHPTPEKWLLDGIRLFIETFMPNRINFRIYPFDNCPSFQLLCNLKSGCFVDQDLEHLLYGYGNRPTVPLAVFGLITSIPPSERDPFDPLKEFEDESKVDDTVVFEKRFRAIFGAMDGIENLLRYSRYPNISVHPIAVFRQFELPAVVTRG